MDAHCATDHVLDLWSSQLFILICLAVVESVIDHPVNVPMVEAEGSFDSIR